MFLKGWTLEPLSTRRAKQFDGQKISLIEVSRYYLTDLRINQLSITYDKCYHYSLSNVITIHSIIHANGAIQIGKICSKTSSSPNHI